MAKLASFNGKAPAPQGQDASFKSKTLSNGVKKPWELVPEGEFIARIKSFEIKPTKDGTGEYLNVKFEVDLTDKRKLLVFQKFHLKNKNPKCAMWDLKRLNFLAMATGLEGLSDTDDLNNVIDVDFLAGIKIDPGNNGFPDSNKITRFGRI